MNEMEQKVLKTLSHQYKNIAAASTEIINLQSILNLPKGTEHFLTDIHGEYEQFNHVLKNGSGSVRRKIDEEFGNTISNKDKKSLATLIYYPESKLEIVEREEDNLEDGYGINLLPLATFALETYENTNCDAFTIKFNTDYNTKDLGLDTKMHKAIAILQFKLEGQLIMRHPEFHMEDRMLLHRIDFEKKTICVDGKEYPMKDVDFPTVDPVHPYELTEEESKVMLRLQQVFMRCEKLQRHVKFLFSKGGMYKIYNGNLLYHGCVPLNPDGSFMQVEICGKEYCGKALYDILEYYARRGYYAKEAKERALGQDMIWYIWAGPGSPVFGKAKMATFERYFLKDKETHIEEKNSYYKLLENEEVIGRILEEFGLDKADAHIVNGHVPVEQIHGESPIKCGGKLLIIDGGFSKAYQKKTGIAGYTLVCNSRGMRLVAHEPFESTEAAIIKESDIFSDSVVVENFPRRKLVADTDTGKEIQENIFYLEELLEAYREGTIMEEV